MNTQLEQRPDLGNIMPLAEQDIKMAAQMYLKVAITEKNYLERLREGKNSFHNRGGMFLIQNQEILTKLLHSPEERLRLAWHNGRPGGLLWYGDWYEEAFRGLEAFPESEHPDDILLRLGEQGRLGYVKEIIVTESAPGGATAWQLLLEMMESFCCMGKTHAVAEVYRVKEYEDGQGRHRCDMLNMPSFSTLRQSGGVHIGQTPARQIEMKGFRVVIRPQVFLWDTAKSVEILRSLLHRTEETG